MYANDPAIPEATREVLRRFAPSLIRLQDLDGDRYRAAFSQLVQCAERTLLIKLYAELKLRPFVEKSVDAVGDTACGALYVAAPVARVRDVVTEAYQARGLERFPRNVDNDGLIPASRHVTWREWPPATLERWHDDIVLVLPESDRATCVASREWETSLPGRNELAADLSRSFPVLAVTQTDAFREVSLYRGGTCEASRVVSSIAKYRRASHGALPAYDVLEELFGLAIGDVEPDELIPSNMANQGYSQDIGSIYDSHAHERENVFIEEILGFVRPPESSVSTEAPAPDPAPAPAPARSSRSTSALGKAPVTPASGGGEAVLAIVAKGVFEKDHPGAAPGDLLPLDAYTSKNAALRKVAGGGTLFLVTARPNDRLWLVAILEHPTFDGERWRAPVNRVPITDITDRIDRMIFANGAGLTFRPGQLGMSLQTPRALAPDTAALLRGEA